MTHEPSAGKSGLFPVTAWDVVRAAQNADDPEQARQARNQFFSTYWRPVFYWMRARGLRPHEADEMTQAFFERFLHRDWMSKLDQKRGHFRGFLRVQLDWFMADRASRAPAQERFERELASIDSLMTDEDRTYEPPSHETPETAFNRRWARDLLARAKRNLQRLCQNRGKPVWYDLFAAAHFGETSVGQRDLAGQFGVTRDEVRKALPEVTEWFRVKLREQVLQEVGSEADIDLEIAELFGVLGD
jgi:RNA polymerase sigma-70 factor (ECF subfamily)